MSRAEQLKALIEFVKFKGKDPSLLSGIDFSKYDFGIGKFKEILLPLDDKSQWTATDIKNYDLIKELIQTIESTYQDAAQDIINSLKNASLTSYFTSPQIVDAMVAGLDGLKPKKIFEPSAGTGNYLSILANAFPDASIVAIEKEQLTAEILEERSKNISPNIRVFNRPLEEDRESGFDLAISNIPFGDIKIYDSQLYKEANPEKIKASTRIHNYFFVKTLDKLEPGGIISFLVSSALMDSPGNESVRNYLMKNTDLIHAYRLPDQVFKSESTQVTTDVITLRKNTGKKKLLENEARFVKSVKIELPNDKGELRTVNFNEFYMGSRNVIGDLVCDGQYGNDTAVAKWKGTDEDFAQRLSQMAHETRQALSKLPGVVIQKDKELQSKIKVTPVGMVAIDSSYPIHPMMTTGSLMTYKGKAGVLDLREEDRYIRLIPEIKDIAKIEALSNLRNIAKSLIAAEQNDLSKMDALRQDLNEAYSNFTFTYDSLHRNPSLLSLDADESMLLALENLVEIEGKKTYQKADIFNMRVNGVKAEMVAPQSLSDSILYSLNSVGRIDIELISSATGRSDLSIIQEGVEQGLIYYEADGIGGVRPVTKDEFLSGNIYLKIQGLQDPRIVLPFGGDEQLEIYRNMLEAIKPPPIPMELIDINIGERWIREEIYERFAMELFGAKTTVRYLEGTKSYMVNLIEYSPIAATEMSITAKNGDKINGQDILKHALMNTSPSITYNEADPKDPSKSITHKDMDAIMSVRQKIDEVKAAFKKYIKITPDLRQELESKYNKLFNNNVLRKYDGSHLTFGGFDYYKPHPHQKDTVWQICQNNGGIADQNVGTGKTLVMILSAMELRRLGIAKKPCITAMKANAAAIAEDFKKCFPNAKVLYPRPVDYDVKKRREFLHKIMTGDWDAVILSHEQFGMIPQSAHIIDKMITGEINALSSDMARLNKEEGYSAKRKSALKSLEKKKASLLAKLNGKVDGMKKDSSLPTFDELGIDHLFVDESHNFKNLQYTTHFENVKGLGSPLGSDRATNMLLAIRTIQEKLGGDKGVTLLSGTPISNSLVELPLLFKYMIPDKLKELGIDTVDSFLTTFARKSYDMEFNIAGEIKSVERFREFIKVPEMLNIYRSIANIVTDDNFKIDKPSLKTELIMIKPSSEQLDFNKAIINFVNTLDGSYIGKPAMTESEKMAYALLATNLSRRASMDMRLINPSLPYNPEGKLATVAANIARIYNLTHDFKGTQFVFCDVSTPNEYKFNVYDELKRILVTEHTLSPNDITYIHEHQGDKKKTALFKEVNAGNVRIVLGSTQMMGTGVNMQQRAVATHSLDIPWRPSDRTQRNGRAARQGNWAAKKYMNNEVTEYLYATEQTLDAYQFDILKNKEHFIKQTKQMNLDEVDRTLRESDMGEDGAISARDISAILSGNNDLLERSKVIKKIEAIERNYEYAFSAYNREMHNARVDAGINERTIAQGEDMALKLAKDKKYLDANHKVDADHEDLKVQSVFDSVPTHADPSKKETKKGFEYPMPVVIDSKSLHTTEEVGAAIHEQMKRLRWTIKGGDTVDIGTYGNFQIRISRKHDRELLFSNGAPFDLLVKSSISGISYTFNNGDVNENVKLAGLYIHRAISKAYPIYDKEVEKINKGMAMRETYRNKLERQFVDTYTPQLVDLRKQLSEIDKILNGVSKETIPGVSDESTVYTNKESIALEF